jgi:hypothetical protein
VDVKKENKMKTQDIKNMGLAYLQVLDEALKGGQKKLDMDKDGDIDAKDFAHMRKKKANENDEVEINPKMKTKKKADAEMAVEEVEQVDEISKDLAGRYIKKAQIDTADAADKVARSYDAYDKKQGKKQRKAGIHKIVNRRMGTADAVRKLTGKARVAATEETNEWPVYARIKENRAAHTKGATEPEAMDSKASKGEKDFKAMHKVDMQPAEIEKKGHDDASAAGRVTKPAAPRNGDNKAGDKSIVNPVAGAKTS